MLLASSFVDTSNTLLHTRCSPIAKPEVRLLDEANPPTDLLDGLRVIGASREDGHPVEADRFKKVVQSLKHTLLSCDSRKLSTEWSSRETHLVVGEKVLVGEPPQSLLDILGAPSSVREQINLPPSSASGLFAGVSKAKPRGLESEHSTLQAQLLPALNAVLPFEKQML